VEIIDNRAVVLNLRNPERVTTIIPKSKKIGDHKVLVNWGVEEAQVLKNMGITIPSPIEGQYNWTGQHKPYEHQKTTASFLTMHRKAFCFSEMGVGKSATAIWAADYLLKKGIINRVLVICPLSIMDSAWRADLFSFAMHRTVSVAHGAREKRVRLINEGSDFVIINFDGVGIVSKEVAEGGFDLIIADECSAYKSPSTNRWKVLNKLVRPETWLWMMTGTPAAQSPVDAYGLAKLVNPSGVPRYQTAFKDQVMFKISTFKWLPKANSKEVVFNALQPAIRFTKDECLDLPEMSYVKRIIEMTRQQKKYYEHMREKMSMQAAGEQITAANAAVNMNKLLQISAGAIYTEHGDALEFDIKHRYKVLREVIDETSQKTLVFVSFKHVIDILTAKLKADGITTEVIRGDVTAGNRTRIFKEFQEKEDPRVLVIQPQSAAHGVTLTAANTVVWWGPTPSIETYLQANARVHRSGQHHPCTVVQLQGSKVEEHVYSLLDNKIDVHTKMIDLYKEILD